MGATTAIEKENVVMRAGDCSVTILPRLGGKIASIQVHGTELLQAPLADYAPRTRTMSFDAGDASGWDECLPSVAACAVETEAGMASVPDHGDLWRVEWTTKQGPGTAEKQGLGTREQGLETRDEGLGTSRVVLRGECFSLPLALERKVALSETAEGWLLELEYSVTNIGSFAAPWSWAAHPLFVADEGDRIVLPESVKTLRLEGSGGGRLGKGGDTVGWPMASLADGGLTDLSVAYAAESGFGDKLFTGRLGGEDNWCAIERPRAGLRIRVGFDAEATPYLGLWICYGGWPERPGPKQVCVALEPATAPVDSLAVTGPWSRRLSAGESYRWRMTVEIMSI